MNYFWVRTIPIDLGIDPPVVVCPNDTESFSIPSMLLQNIYTPTEE